MDEIDVQKHFFKMQDNLIKKIESKVIQNNDEKNDEERCWSQQSTTIEVSW